ncbi:MAG TPA: type II toxin-antitoxin system prevent-host-death family antitoxin [bacterium]|nr:type II toxin-antitoxin system prevent-host-death family antitoxin [bacterium]
MDGMRWSPPPASIFATLTEGTIQTRFRPETGNSMEKIGVYEAKTHLPALLERVSKGEKITITKHGTPLAMLVPLSKEEPKMSVQEAIDGILALRSRNKKKVSLKEIQRMKAKGRD